MVRLLKTFFLFMFIFFAGLCANAEEVTFTAVSNVYLKSDKVSNSMTPSIEKLLKIKDDANVMGSDFVLFLGNNISSADFYDVVMFSKIINKIHKPTYVIVANKDIQRGKSLSKKEYYRLLNKFSKNKLSKVPSAKKINGFVFVFMDGINETVTMPRAYYREAELIKLEKTLNKYKNKNVIIVQHFPVFDENGNVTSTYNPKPYINLLAKYDNIKAVISGDTEGDFEIQKDNIKYINVPSLNKTNEYGVISIKTLENGEDKGKILTKMKIINVE